MSIGETIRKRRIALGLSQQQLADLCGYKTRGAINKIETGVRAPLQSKLPLICDALNISLNELYGIHSYNHPEIEIGHSIYTELGELSKEELKQLIQYGKKMKFGNKML